MLTHGDGLDVTVVMATFNRQHLVSRALDSIAAQVRRPRQVIVVDDASSDDTVATASKWVDRHSLDVRVVRLPDNRGPASARNRGIELATTRYVAFLDSDDEHLPDTLERLAAPLDQYADVVLSFSDAKVITGSFQEETRLLASHIALEHDGEPLATRGSPVYRLKQAKAKLLAASIIPTSATCFRRDAAAAVGGMPEDFRHGEDWLFWLRLAATGSFAFQLDPLAMHYRHDDNISDARHAVAQSKAKMHGYARLLDGTLGIALNAEERKRVAGMLHRQTETWRYNLSRQGIRRYLNAIRREAHGPHGKPWLYHVLRDPQSLVRAAAFSIVGRAR